jgi:hypothetical protein
MVRKIDGAEYRVKELGVCHCHRLDSNAQASHELLVRAEKRQNVEMGLRVIHHHGKFSA